MERTLKSIRFDLGLSQKELAKKLGISELSYRNKEQYRTGLTAKELIQISELSDIDPRDIKLA